LVKKPLQKRFYHEISPILLTGKHVQVGKKMPKFPVVLSFLLDFATLGKNNE